MITASVEQAPANSSDLIVYVSIGLFLFLVDGVSHLDFFNFNYPGSRTSLKLTGSILVRRFLSYKFNGVPFIVRPLDRFASVIVWHIKVLISYLVSLHYRLGCMHIRSVQYNFAACFAASR